MKQSDNPPPFWTRRWWTGILCLLVVASLALEPVPKALREYKAGTGLLPALLDAWGIDKEFVRYLGDAMIPMVLAVLLLGTAYSLPRGRKRTIMIWVAWAGFVFVMAWWPWLHMAAVHWAASP